MRKLFLYVILPIITGVIVTLICQKLPFNKSVPPVIVVAQGPQSPSIPPKQPAQEPNASQQPENTENKVTAGQLLERYLSTIKWKSQEGISYEEFSSLLHQADLVRQESTNVSDRQIKALSCYNEVKTIWSKATPEYLQNNGIVGSYYEAQDYFKFNVEREWSRKFQECYSY